MARRGVIVFVLVCFNAIRISKLSVMRARHMEERLRRASTSEERRATKGVNAPISLRVVLFFSAVRGGGVEKGD